MNSRTVAAAVMRRSGSLDWSREGKTWPHAQYSRFVQAGGLCWHVQQMGDGPALLLLHGTGASAHSWRYLAPLLAERHTVIAPDLPGHGFTQAALRQGLSLPAMAGSVAALLDVLGIRPLTVVGHSAGAAILIRCCLDGLMDPKGAVSINGALLPFRGPAGYLFPPLAKLMFINPLTARLFARSAVDRNRVARLIQGTGSELDKAGIDLYARLFTSPNHIAATLGMMAHWNLQRLANDLPELEIPLLLLATARDKAVAPSEAERLARLVPGSRSLCLPGLGHLAHEEDPQAVLEPVLEFIASVQA